MSEPARPIKSGATAKIVTAAQNARANTLGLRGPELNAIYERLDMGATGGSFRRHSARLAYRLDSISIELSQPGGMQTHLSVACRNLSRTGLGFLHSAYIHEGTAVVTTLRHKTEGMVRVVGKVVRCRHVTRHVHDVGIRFDSPVNIRDFVELDPLKQTFTCEIVDPKHLEGLVLIVAEYGIEQACVRSMLADTALEFVTASTIQEGLDRARKGVGLVICDDVFEVGSGVEFVKSARAKGIRCPMILMSADTSVASLDQIRKAETDAFLAKPLKQDVLMRAVAEFLLVGGDKSESSSPLQTTLPAGSPMSTLADSFVEDLHSTAEKIEELVTKGDLAAIRRLCLRVGGPSCALGFDPISKMAARLVASLDSTKSVEQCSVGINTFVSVCRSSLKGAKAPPAPAAPAEGAAPAEADKPQPDAKAEAEHKPHAKAA
jgi:CheY-like chemotaxis protein